MGPVKNGKKIDPLGSPRIETDRYPASGIELAPKDQGARYREGLYPISTPRRIFSDISSNRYVFEFLSIDDVDIRH